MDLDTVDFLFPVVIFFTVVSSAWLQLLNRLLLQLMLPTLLTVDWVRFSDRSVTVVASLKTVGSTIEEAPLILESLGAAPSVPDVEQVPGISGSLMVRATGRIIVFWFLRCSVEMCKLRSWTASALKGQ